VEVAALRREQQRAEERAEAVADVIQTIARTRFDLGAVLQAVIDRSVDLCGADSGNIARREGDVFRVVAFTSFSPAFERLVRERMYVPERGSVIGRTLLERRVVQITDVLADEGYELAEIQQAGGYRTLLGVPMLLEGEPIGAIVLGRREVRPFDEAEIRLIETCTAVAISKRFTALTGEWRKRGYDLGLGMGIATGYATLGRIGFEGRYDYGPVGNVVILAARLADAAAPGEILLSQRTHARIDDRVVSEPTPELRLKGMSRPVAAHRVVALRD
jgi:hypothetical protein